MNLLSPTINETSIVYFLIERVIEGSLQLIEVTYN